MRSNRHIEKIKRVTCCAKIKMQIFFLVIFASLLFWTLPYHVYLAVWNLAHCYLFLLTLTAPLHHRNKKQIPIFEYFRVFKENQQKSQIWKSETSPSQGTWFGIPWLGLLSHFTKFEIFVGILYIRQNIQYWESVIFFCALKATLS